MRRLVNSGSGNIVREIELHIFIDESGTFVPDVNKCHSIAAVGALVIPSSSMETFERLYGCLRKRLPKIKGEVKGRTLSEDQIADVARLLRSVNALFEVVSVDMGIHSKHDLLRHKAAQEQAITAHLTPQHQTILVEQVWSLRRTLEDMSMQLYVQSVAMGELVYHTLNHANTYHAFRAPCELGEYHWRVDAKDRLGVTPWEQWWSTVVLPALESRSFRKPFLIAEGGDYRWQERFKKFPSDYKLRHTRDPKNGVFYDLRMVMTEDLSFSSDPEFGLEAVDVVTNTIRRSLSGNLGRSGWIEVPQLMIHRAPQYIKMISLSRETIAPDPLPYLNVIEDFLHGGQALVPD